MKRALFILLLLLSFNLKAEKTQSNYWTIIKSELDTTVNDGFCKIKIIVENLNSSIKLKDVDINLNVNSFLGKTDIDGVLETTIKIGINRICADTPDGGSFYGNYNFKNKFSYVIKIKMRKKELINPPSSHTVKKPIIYLYPTSRQKINVKIEPKGDFVFTYPSYPESGWSIIGNPNGKIEYNERSYNYLFWEADSHILNQVNLKTGFIVNSDTVVQFLENTLAKVGLSDVEQADFITYWAPQLELNKINFIHFEFNEGYDKFISKMIITPKPESSIRVFMLYKPINKPHKCKPQLIPSYTRKGFTVIEWGGTKL